MASLDDPGVKALLDKPNHAVLSTLAADGTIHSTVVWIGLEVGQVSLNTAVGRAWPSNIERNPNITVVVYDAANPYEYIEVRGTAQGTTDGADEHIDRLAKKYLDADSYPFRQPGEQRITYAINPARIRHQVPPS